MFKKLYHIALRECGIMWKNPIYLFCMVIFPIVVVIFFTTLMKGGVPTDMPVGIVDQDNSATSRQLVHKLDAFQTTKVVAHYENMAEARHAIQKNEIYAFLLIPDGTEAGLMAQKQPKISFYYSSVSLAAGSLLFRDLKTISTLGGAAAGMAKLSALGKTNDEIMTFLQPIAVDLHMIGNPYANYNYYLSSVMVPGLIMLFIFLITPYSIGTELKFNRARDWMRMAGNNPNLAIAGKMLPQTLIFLSIFLLFEFYIYYVLQFPHPGARFLSSVRHSERTLLPVFRHLCLRTDAFIAHVDEYLFVVGRGEFLHLRSHLSALLDGFSDPVYRPAFPDAPLLHDLPDEHLQWFPYERCCAPLGRNGGVLRPADTHCLEHQEGNAGI